MKTHKTCGVCGDVALGYNFNAVTCESCKAFFRRNALKRKVFTCPFDGKCNIDITTRRFCQKCRLNKCFSIGMKKEWILTEEEKKMKRAKIEENRQKKPKHDLAVLEADTSDSATCESIIPLDTVKCTPPVDTDSKSLTSATKKCQQVDASSVDCSSNSGSDCTTDKNNNDENQSNSVDSSVGSKVQLSVKSMDHEDVPMMVTVLAMSAPNITMSTSGLVCQTDIAIKENAEHESGNVANGSTIDRSLLNLNCFRTLKQTERTNTDNIVNKVMQIAIETEFANVPIRDYNSNFKELSEAERSKLEELIVANEILKMPLTLGVPDPSLIDVINMTDHAIRRLIKMSKKITGFKKLCEDDQIALLKGSCTELMILRSVMSYDPEKDCWNGPQGPKSISIKVDILKEAKGNVYEEHKRFINSFDPVWRTDENIMLILSAIALFTPERPNVVHKDKVKLEQNTYYYLLRRYLETVYSGCEARSNYLKLIKKSQELHILNENHVRVFLDLDPKDVEPLLIEIFDLKH